MPSSPGYCSTLVSLKFWAKLLAPVSYSTILRCPSLIWFGLPLFGLVPWFDFWHQCHPPPYKGAQNQIFSQMSHSIISVLSCIWYKENYYQMILRPTPRQIQLLKVSDEHHWPLLIFITAEIHPINVQAHLKPPKEGAPFPTHQVSYAGLTCTTRSPMSKALPSPSLLKLSNISCQKISTLFSWDWDSCQWLYQLPSGLPLLSLLQTFHACSLHSSGWHCSRYFLSHPHCLLVFGISSLIIVMAEPIIVEGAIHNHCTWVDAEVLMKSSEWMNDAVIRVNTVGGLIECPC